MQRRSRTKTKTSVTSRASTTARVKSTGASSSLSSISARAVSSSSGSAVSASSFSRGVVTSSARHSRPSAAVATKRSFATTRQEVALPSFTKSSPSFTPIVSAPVTTTKRHMSERAVPGKIFFSTDHEYLKFDTPTTAFIGISDHAQESLGEIVFVDLPKVGSIVEKGQSFAAVESVKSANDIYAPVSMEILKVNTDLDDQVSLVNEDAQGKGWMVHVNVRDVSEIDQLMDEEAYNEFCNH